MSYEFLEHTADALKLSYNNFRGIRYSVFGRFACRSLDRRSYDL